MIRFLPLLCLLLVLQGCGAVHFKEMPLYNRYEQTADLEKEAYVVFDEESGTLWSSLGDCGEFNVFKGKAAVGNSFISLAWNKGKDCEWLGFGNSFSNWNAVDMSEERNSLALSFFVRSTQETVNAIPIVACLEDFGGGGSYLFLDSKKYLLGLQIDTIWRRMIVPLWDFPVREEEVDIQAIKQMKFQLEGSGAFQLDEIKLVPFSREEYAESRRWVASTKRKGEPEQEIYKEGFLDEYAWGQHAPGSQVLAERTGPSGERFIHWDIIEPGTGWAKWGINWNGWYQVNLSGLGPDARLKFKVKAEDSVAFRIELYDFQGHVLPLGSFSKGPGDQGWTEVEISLSELGATNHGLVLDQIKELQFQGLAKGKVLLDDIRITKR